MSRDGGAVEAVQGSLLTNFGRPRQVWELAGGPVVAGLVCGLALHVNTWAYVVGVVLVVAGGRGVGTQHRTLAAAAARGLWGGTLWAGALLVTHAVIATTTTSTASVALPQPETTFLLWSAIPSGVIAVVSFTVARRAHGRTRRLRVDELAPCARVGESKESLARSLR
jgi:hypothetical protein